MRALIQRVARAKVEVDQQCIGEINQGLLVFIGVEKGDRTEDADRLLKKLLAYRVFADAEDKMNLSLTDVQGGLLLVSQFTLAANTQKGLRPSFSSAAPPAEGEDLYNYLVEQAKGLHPSVATGRFGADMKVELLNDGPATFLLET
ncbi:D-aminoacyl-tRNA deacylase [Oceanospirillum linum]|uniref:D-aminoacyl-tRNA deacylase n=1 Tax=Oceanospirillum linum TaxID=966 RepID=A0A1T1HBG0_OCELI|nr:D-aminoacyl-tRNA deacylase [Oceanospirillum linum]OOV87152.1 D-tyrosyl-tRNA(Tyr) deacylase [Oceanospirillum linum]SEF76274.1 D-tyrosyl-tRNA(Tyr) deacylase [Oleiphilus messinensis]SMP17424.1 D-tyrosyl-tRNA(Tyr) deacylase [Oceanospirillum linum]